MPKIYSGDLTKMFDISGKKAMIFGGHGGFGKAIAEGYAANGCSVCISARNEAKLQEAVKDIEAKAAPGVKVMYIAGDASDENFVQKAVEVVTGPDGIGGCDILVNAQGINRKMWSWEIDNDFFRQMLNINITSLMLTCKYFGNWMKSNNIEGAEQIPESEFEPQPGLRQDHQLRLRPRHPRCRQRRQRQRPLQHHQGRCRDADQGLRC